MAEQTSEKQQPKTQDRRQRKLGDQTLKAMASLGLEELRNALYHGSNVAQHSTEPGMWGDRSYGDLVEDRIRSADAPGRSSLSDRIRQVEIVREAPAAEPPELSQ